ncbi:MAG: hypothetical protein PHX21_05760 [bacterium]|nr:hypothetical protein [bacterium]
MNSLNFSLRNYKYGIKKRHYAPPKLRCPYYEIDPVVYRNYETTNKIKVKLSKAWRELHKRTGESYFSETYPLQARTLDYSAKAFPSYRFILPEVIKEDWLAIVDWDKYQRDHTLHQSLCGYVVLKLLDNLTLPDGKLLLDRCVEQILNWQGTAYIRDFLIDCGMNEDDDLLKKKDFARIVWRTFFREAAYIAAIFHDIGYPWQYAERIQGNLDKLNTPAIKQNQSAKQVIDMFSHRLLFHAMNGYKKVDAACPSTWQEKLIQITDVALSKTHGLPGALGFLYLNDCVRRYPPTTQSPLNLLCVEWTAVAIMMHDMRKIYWGQKISTIPENPFLRLSFDKDPLSSLLTLVDVIQEFARPTVKYDVSASSKTKKKKPNKLITLEYKEDCHATKLKIDKNGVLTLCYQMCNGSARAIKRKFLLDDKREYFDTQYGYLDMSSIGINDVQLTVF